MKRLSSSIVLVFLLVSAHVSAETAVIVNPSTGDNISTDQVSRIFLGKVNTFPSGKAAVPYNLPEGNPAREAFESEVVGRDGSQLKAYWSKLIFTGKGTPPKELDASAVKQKVANDPNAIGYIDASEVDGSVKVVTRF